MKLLLIGLIIAIGCNSLAQNNYLGVDLIEIETALNKHLSNWYPAIIDTANGGYYINLEHNWTLSKNQDKMLVTQGRGLWTAAKAANTLNKNQLYINAAHHGFSFFTKQLWDDENGGFRLMYYIDNSDKKETHNLVYANAFALFALAEYAKLDQTGEALVWAEKTFDWMDSVAHDEKLLGYYNLINYNTDTSGAFGWDNPTWKDQNTSIHLLEAFTLYYQINPSNKVKKRLEEMLILIRDTMTQANGSLKLFFTPNWQAIDYSDSTREFILSNQNFDHVSFGHNIETAYLLIDASKTLYGKVDSTTLRVAKKLCDHSVKYGFAPNFNGIYDRGYDFGSKGTIEIIDKRKSWWAQFEALHTLALMTQYFPDETIYVKAFQNMWQYIDQHLTDHEHGGYYYFGIDETPSNKNAPKGQNWKGPYHDGRTLIQIWQYANQQKP
ncbi:MAG TPA: AGE family epimerase/isomerase [Prolixibacteraceae bacterium]|nr:AGE family epimerase/isomerase [Prolixibacteraceae bacterium]